MGSQLRRNFDTLCKAMLEKDLTGIRKLVDDEVLCFLSTSIMNDGAQHSVFGLRDLAIDIPENISPRITVLFDYDFPLDDQKDIQYITAKYHIREDLCVLFQIINIWKEKLVETRFDLIDVNDEVKDLFASYWNFRERFDRIISSEMDVIYPNGTDAYTVAIKALIALNHLDFEAFASLSNKERVAYSKSLFENHWHSTAFLPVYSLSEFEEDDDEAKAVLYDQNDNTVIMNLKRIDGEWKIINGDDLIAGNHAEVIDKGDAHDITDEFINSFIYCHNNRLYRELSNMISDRFAENAIRYGRHTGKRNLLKALKSRSPEKIRAVRKIEQKEDRIFFEVYLKDSRLEIEIEEDDGWKLLYVYEQKGCF